MHAVHQHDLKNGGNANGFRAQRGTTLARYAALCQEAGLVPIVEPEVLMDGVHTLEQCRKVTKETLRNVFIQLNCQRVLLEGMILKPNMVLPGFDRPVQESVNEVADATVKTLLMRR